ncbi:hypothetical protein N7488_009973 [Penicillium malachiteum]|nr:hypothetical protein N7488_009973 [Penicillium malachiteum]
MIIKSTPICLLTSERLVNYSAHWFPQKLSDREISSHRLSTNMRSEYLLKFNPVGVPYQEKDLGRLVTLGWQTP